MWTDRNLLVLAALLAVGALWWFTEANRNAPTAIECAVWTTGAPVYRATVSTEYATNDTVLLGPFAPAAQSTGSAKRRRISGEFYLQFQPGVRQESGAQLTVHIQDADLQPGTAISGSWRDSTSDSMHIGPGLSADVRMDRSCAIAVLGVDADDGGDDDGHMGPASSFAEGLLLLLDFHLPSSPLSDWTSEQQDRTGIYLADYQLMTVESGDIHIYRQRQRYRQLGEDLERKGYRAHIVESNAFASLDPGAFWFSTISGVEDLSLLKDGVAVVQTRVEFDLQRMPDGFSPPPPALHSVASEDPPLTDTDPSTAPDAELAAELEVEAGPTRPPEQVLESFRSLLDEGQMSEAVGVLVTGLQQDSTLADRVYSWLLDGSIRSRNIALVFLALSKAGTDQAVAVLETVFADPAASDQRRSQAAFALASVTPPSIEIATALALQLDRAGTDQSFSSRSALMALGHMASLIDDPDDATKAYINNTIEDQLQLATRDQALAAALSAAHNSGDARLYPSVRLQLSSPSPRIRGLAMEAIAAIDAPASRSDLYGHLAEEPDAATEAIAIDSLARVIKDSGTKARPEEIALVAGIMKSTPNSRLKRSAVEFLSAETHSDDARQALLDQVTVETDPDVLRALGQALSAEELRSVSRRNRGAGD